MKKNKGKFRSNYESVVYNEKSLLDDDFKDFWNDKEDKWRRTGRTTRMIDSFIQDFFNRGKCEIHDHYVDKKSYDRVMDIVLERLSREHGIRNNDIIVNRNNFTISRE